MAARTGRGPAGACSVRDTLAHMDSRTRPSSARRVAADAEALAAPLRRARLPVHDGAGPRSGCRLLDDPERTLLVAVAAGRLAGFVDVHVQRVVEADPYAEVGGLVVAAGHRGEGLGAALLAAAADWGRSAASRSCGSAPTSPAQGAHDFYPAVGCRPVKDQRVYEYPL